MSPEREQEYEPMMNVHSEGIPGTEKLVVEIKGKDREQAEISEMLSAKEAVERIPQRVFENGIYKGKVLSAMAHLDGHIRAIDLSTIENPSILPGGRQPEILFAIPPQETQQLENGLTAAGFTIDSENNGLVAEFHGGDVVSFLYDSKKAKSVGGDAPEQDEESAPNEAGEY